MSATQTTRPDYEDEIDLRVLIKTLWAGKLVILSCTVIVAAIAIAYALLATGTYRSQASVQIRDENRASLTSQMGGLAALAGISIGGQSQNRELVLAALKSRIVIQRMIEDEKLLPILYADDWDVDSESWRTPVPPTPWVAYTLFTDKILKVSEDRKSGMVTVAIEWKDPALAAEWVNTLIARVNTFVNDATIREAEQNLKFLDQQTKTTSVVELQKSIFSTMESEIKRLMSARNPDTAPMRVIDPALVPERTIAPKRTLLGLLGIILGGTLGAGIVLARSAMRG